MSVLYVMVPAALILAIAALAGFIWAVRSGQYDDFDAHSHRFLFDDDPSHPCVKDQTQKQRDFET